MGLILFIHNDSSDKGKKLGKIIRRHFQQMKLETCSGLGVLKSRLKQFSPHSRSEIYVLLADSKDRLNDLASLIHLLESRRVILVLPDDSDTSLFSAQHFYPRFFTTMNDNSEHLCAVIEKMIQHNDNSQANSK